MDIASAASRRLVCSHLMVVQRLVWILYWIAVVTNFLSTIQRRDDEILVDHWKHHAPLGPAPLVLLKLHRNSGKTLRSLPRAISWTTIRTQNASYFLNCLCFHQMCKWKIVAVCRGKLFKGENFKSHRPPKRQFGFRGGTLFVSKSNLIDLTSTYLYRYPKGISPPNKYQIQI